MRILRPDDLLPQGAGRWTRENVAEAFSACARALRDEVLPDPEIRAVHVLVGPPGAGKTTWCSCEAPHVAQVVYDVVNTDPRRRAALARRIRAAGKDAIAVVVAAPVGLCLERQLARPVWRRVPEPVIRRSFRELFTAPPRLAEGWSEIDYLDGTALRTDRRTTEEEDRRRGRPFYRWRTMEDDKVRSAHAARHGRIYSWNYPPEGGHPGEDFGCRCWPEAVPNDHVVETRGGVLRARPLTVPAWARRR